MHKHVVTLAIALLAWGMTHTAHATDTSAQTFAIAEGDATVTTLTNNGRSPFAVERLSRVIYFSSATYMRDTLYAKMGDHVTVLTTLDCGRRQIRRLIVEKTEAGASRALYAGDDEAMRHMLSLPFRSATAAEEKEARHMCATHLHSGGKQMQT